MNLQILRNVSLVRLIDSGDDLCYYNHNIIVIEVFLVVVAVVAVAGMFRCNVVISPREKDWFLNVSPPIARGDGGVSPEISLGPRCLRRSDRHL